eukprot:Skav233937  [mRNA]  locus=scaffold2178:39983:46648:- [translate_table: standard]
MGPSNAYFDWDELEAHESNDTGMHVNPEYFDWDELEASIREESKKRRMQFMRSTAKMDLEAMRKADEVKAKRKREKKQSYEDMKAMQEMRWMKMREARGAVREKRKREIRGGGHEEQEEGMEEEKVFTDDEPVEVPDEVASVPGKVDQVPDEVAEVSDKVAENEVEKSRSEKAAGMRRDEGMKRKASTDSVGSVHTPVAVVMKRMRMKGPGPSAMSSSPVMSTPSPIVLSKECPPGGLEAQTVQYGWLLMRYFCSGKRMNELENITMLDPMLCHALGAVKKEEEHGLELDKLIQLFKREMSHKKTFFLPLMSGGHWALLVVDKIHDDIRYYDSLCGDPDRSKIGTEDEITNLPEKCLAMAERLLGAMMSLSVVPDGFCDRPALRRANVRTRQPWGTNQCGHFILAYMEAELLNELGYGPAASGWPAASAHHWHERLRKLTNQLHEEIPKYKRDLKAADEKLLRSGERAHAEMVKEAKVAQMRLDKQETLTELQKTAYEFVHENRYIKISELPPECEKDRMRIIHHEVGVCSRCRNQSGCLNCNEWKCIRAYMRKEHKRTGRPIEPQYQ